MRIFRGSIVKLKICIAMLILFCGFIPAYIIIHSLIYLGQENQILLALILLLFINLMYGCLISEYYPQYKFKTNILYRTHTFIDSYSIRENVKNVKKIVVY
jgi:hypothetical protein